MALLGLVAILALAITSLFIAGLRGPSLASERVRNAQVLQLARHALVGHVAHQAALATENNPGRLPCPEAPGYFGTTSEGVAAASCKLPAVGRLPWRTLGIEKPRDAAGEVLWYAVSPGWALPNVSSFLSINSDTPGRLVLDGRADAAVALLIAPGRPLQVNAAAECAPRDQRRRARDVAGNPLQPDVRDHLECLNASMPADLAFASSGPAGSFNDQVLAVTVADLLPALEGAISARIQRDVVPALRAAYAGPDWGALTANPLFPYAARFAEAQFNPDAWRGRAGETQGLLPFTRAQGCDPATENRCDPTFVAWRNSPAPAFEILAGSTMEVYLAPAVLPGSRCSVEARELRCTLYTSAAGELAIALSGTASNVAMALRRIDKAVAASGFAPDSPATRRGATATMGGDGSAAVRFSASVNAPGTEAACTRMGSPPVVFSCQQRLLALPIDLLADHALLDPERAQTGWFVRNRWHELLYYAIAPGHAANASAPRHCSSEAPRACLKVELLGNGTEAGANARALLILAGRSLTGSARPGKDLKDYLESERNRDGNADFEQRRIGRSYNDRVLLVDANP